MRSTALAVALGTVLAWVASGRADERVDITAMDGAQLVGELAGTTGPGVVLTHGKAEDRRRWKDVAATVVAHGFRVLRFDLRGHGESSGSPEAAATERDVEGAYRYLLGRKIRPVFLVSTDTAAGATLAVASRVPVAGVALIGTTPREGLQQVPVLSLPSDSPEAIQSLVEWLSDPRGK